MESFASIFGVSFVLALSGAVMPGPMLTVVIRESSRGTRSFRAWSTSDEDF